jgi:RNA polymerase sigma-70 factor (ECF subfamily)
MVFELTNDLLMQRVAKGDTKAFRHLAHALGQRMFNLAYRLLDGQRAAAEDAVQEAMIKLWRNAPKWKPDGSVESYISRLVYTASMDQRRKHKPYDEIPEELSATENPFEDAMKHQNRQHLLAAIETLPERQRQAVLLHYMEDQSQNSVAKILGTSEKAIERLLARARTQLQNLMNKKPTGTETLQ